MQGRWLIATVTTLLVVLSLTRLSHTWYVNTQENDAARLYPNNEEKQKDYLENEASKDTVDLFFTKYNYLISKEKEIGLGLDLKGGVNVILQLQVKDLLLELSEHSKDPIFIEALQRTDEEQKNSDASYLSDFFDVFDEVKKEKGSNLKLAAPEIFGNRKNAELVKFNMSDDKVRSIISEQIESKISTAYEVLSSRIDRFGVTQPNIQRIGGEADGKIAIELPGVKDTEGVQKLLQTTAVLQFWRSIKPSGDEDFSQALNSYISSLTSLTTDTIKNNQSASLQKYLNLAGGLGYAVGAAKMEDTAKVNEIFKSTKALNLRPALLKGAKFFWSQKPEGKSNENFLLYCLVGDRDNEPLLQGDIITGANSYMDNLKGEHIVSMDMNSEAGRQWAKITSDNVGKNIAIVLDDLVYTAPNIETPITGGSSQITGRFTQSEAKALSSVLEAGSLPTGAKIIQAEVVGPTLGQESIDAGMISFAIALLLVLLWMIFYYGGAGIFANIALIINMVLVFGVLAEFGLSLTLPGIAGIILTIGMAVDANVIIFERVKEELRKGRNVKQAVATAFTWKGALSAIIDANVTTFITAVVLFIFGEGPVKGFATTLMVGILTSLFTGVLLGYFFLYGRLSKGKNITFYTGITKNWLSNINIKWINKRKPAYIISAILILISVISLATRGLDFGVDFQGGRSYVIQLNQNVTNSQLSTDLAPLFTNANGTTSSLKIKKFGAGNKYKVTTNYKQEIDELEVDIEIKNKLYQGLKKYVPANIDENAFTKPGEGSEYGIFSSLKVGSTISDDIRTNSFIYVSIALGLVFLYLLFQFRKWQFSLGAVIAVIHDSIIVLGIFSLFHGIVGFSLEIDQAFVAAILTVIGYSLNDTVIIYDRIREFLVEHKSMPFGELVDNAINSTMSRTINTSLTTLFVILIIFLFGGEAIKGFMFALLVGISIGTYSSVFVAAPIVYDLTKGELKNRKK